MKKSKMVVLSLIVLMGIVFTTDIPDANARRRLPSSEKGTYCWEAPSLKGAVLKLGIMNMGKNHYVVSGKTTINGNLVSVHTGGAEITGKEFIASIMSTNFNATRIPDLEIYNSQVVINTFSLEGIWHEKKVPDGRIDYQLVPVACPR